MNIILCLSKNKGFTFFNQRQSFDRNMIFDMIMHVNNRKLYISNYTKKLFDNLEINLENIFVLDKHNKEQIGEDDFIFIEKKEELIFFENAPKEIVVYNWNREYPTDYYFEFDFSDYLKIKEECIVGNSHEEITKIVYKK
ncbi:hypothetical protein ABGF49_07165 [Helcococcus ovis]|uniref:Uncharacterized protein n=1 Tax=Helcococcus ovis TaxID=72026 RepID=A0A4V3IY66_9FIRM|nr:hypothetical protein [Helcococcus ovis]TFF65210.1 hypothetical protein EQF91_06420 [Helcococcus ovis]TFF65767.1 hypothetical protein EQF92_01750 [Helcococcus ovis]TFF68533.1 hypothetical protein EQF93_02165 [Helcococcus ovis]WNZ01407.1 hypothetical protein EQF90_000755 [Helcococcus ovis]